MLGDSKLLTGLQNYNIEKLGSAAVKKCRQKIGILEKLAKMKLAEDPKGLVAFVKNKSLAAGGLFGWVKATTECYDVYTTVKPLREMAAKMKAELERAMEDLKNTKARVKELQEKVAILK